MGWVVLVVLLSLVIAGAPMWPYSREWGYGPSGLFSAAMGVVLVLLFAGTIPPI